MARSTNYRSALLAAEIDFAKISMKASLAKSIPLIFLAALIPGLANAIEIKTSQVPTVHVQVPHVTSPQFKGSIITYRQGTEAQSHVMKPPARTKYDSITVNRGVTSNQSFQQWQQGVRSGSGASVSGAAATKCYGC